MLNHDALLFSPTRDGVPSSDDNFYASDLIAAQDALEAEAREAVPYAAECSYDLGYIKQPLYACRTCLNYKAVCVACSVACHAEHDLIELFNRRDFRCDCGTEAMGAGSCCQISGRTDAPRNDRNKYDHNFRGEFCWCGRPYDPHTEENDMIQCIVCEDWCHEPCLMGRQRPRVAVGGGGGDDTLEGRPAATKVEDDEDDDMVLSPDYFDVLVCQRCVCSRDDLRHLLERYAGMPDSGVVIISEDDKVLGPINVPDEDEAQDLPEAREEAAEMADSGNGVPTQPAGDGAQAAKRPEVDDLEASDRPAKRSKTEVEPAAAAIGAATSGPVASSSSLSNTGASGANAPTVDPAGKPTCRALRLASTTDERPLRRLEQVGARMNVYLQEGFMDRWCRCGECLATLIKYPYLLEEEEVYEPPEDPDASKSTFELGMEHLLTRMPRGQALDSITAFSQLSDRLKGFLRPHAEGGTAVTKEDIDRFFEAEREARAQRQL